MFIFQKVKKKKHIFISLVLMLNYGLDVIKYIVNLRFNNYEFGIITLFLF